MTPEAYEQFFVDPVLPSWVEARPEPVDSGSSGEPVRILFSDDQVDAVSRTSYRHTAQRLNNPQGVQAVSQVEIGFDPATQSLTIHSIAVIRDGQRREVATDRGLFRLLQRETNLERQICDGALSAVMLVEDVRVGDILEVQHSTVDRDLVFPGHFSSLMPLAHPFPIDQLYITLRGGESSAVRVTDGSTFDFSEEADTNIWRHHASELKAFTPDLGAPAWMLQAPYVQLSDYQSWSEISVMVSEHWQEMIAKSEDTEDMATLVRECAGGGSPAEVADAAIRFVQTEIRYLGLEDGISSFIPESPSRVFTRRFGDCKDKTLLLCHLLGKLGIASHPVLVNADIQQSVASLLPSPHAFNHVIAMYEIDGQRHFVDPTLGAQGGKTGARFVPTYGTGLPILAEGSELVDMPEPKPSDGEFVVREEFTIGKGKLPTKLAVTTTAIGMEADGLRHALATTGEAGSERGLESIYQEVYPGSSRVGSVNIEDDLESNTLTLREVFTIPSLLQSAGGHKVYGIMAHQIGSRIAGCPDEERELPLALPFPNRVRQIITVHAPQKINLQSESEAIASPGFKFTFDSKVAGRVLNLEYFYENTADLVSKDDYKTYMERLERVAMSTGFGIPAGGGGQIGNFASIGTVIAVIVGLGLFRGCINGDDSGRRSNENDQPREIRESYNPGGYVPPSQSPFNGNNRKAPDSRYPNRPDIPTGNGRNSFRNRPGVPRNPSPSLPPRPGGF